MAIPNIIISEQSQLKSTFIQDVVVNPPESLIKFQQFSEIYLELERRGLKKEMDRELFTYHKNSQIYYAKNLSDVLSEFEDFDVISAFVTQNLKISEPVQDAHYALAAANLEAGVDVEDLHFLNANNEEYRFVVESGKTNYTLFKGGVKNTQDDFHLVIIGNILIVKSLRTDIPHLLGSFELVK